MKENRHWSLLLEATAIVASILLAFAIDAWWESRTDRVAEQSAIKRLIVDFTNNRAQLIEIRNIHEQALNATNRLLTMIGPNPEGDLEIATIGRILVDCLTNPTLNPQVGTVNSLIASGDLRLIQDAQLQSMLIEWPAQADNLIEWQIIERTHGEELIVPLTFDYIAWPDIDVELGYAGEPSLFDSDFEALFSSRRFEGLLDNRRWNLRDIIEDIEKLEQKTDELLEILDSQLHD